jgi:hypothetical protein
VSAGTCTGCRADGSAAGVVACHRRVMCATPAVGTGGQAGFS